MRNWLAKHFPPGWWKTRKALTTVFLVLLPEILIALSLLAEMLGFDFF